MESTPILKVSELLEVLNQTLDYAYPFVIVEGEVSSFKTNHGKYVFFDLKESNAVINCFMMLYQLRTPIKDGMKIRIVAKPKVTTWGRLSFTVSRVEIVGEGDKKKSFDLLVAKLKKEGLFLESKKRQLSYMPQHIAVISSIEAAGYADFIKIVNARAVGMKLDVYNVMVQGEGASDQIIDALKKINQSEILPELIVMIRGGGSRDDLSAYDDELLVRQMAMSRVPIITGIGHEIDLTIADMVADKVGSTPSNVAELITTSKEEIKTLISGYKRSAISKMLGSIDFKLNELKSGREQMLNSIQSVIDRDDYLLRSLRERLFELNPEKVLKRGYALIRGELQKGSIVEVETISKIATVRVENVRKKE